MVKYLTSEEEKRLLQSVEGRYKKRDSAILILMTNTGLRVGELTKLKISDIFNGNGIKDELQVRKQTTKGKRPRAIPLNDKAKKAIRFLLEKRKEPEDLFLISQKKNKFTAIQIFRIIKGASGKAKLDFSPSPHSLRHTFATKVYAKTNNLRTVQKLLGHKSVATTQIYADVTREQLKDAVDLI